MTDRVENFIAPNGKLWSELRAKKKRKTKKKSRVGKLGIVRLTGKDLAQLRRACFERDGWMCVECGSGVSWDGSSSWEGVPSLYPRGEMAHKVSRGAGGSDTLDNVRTLCSDCHRKEHAYGKSLTKPCPKRQGKA